MIKKYTTLLSVVIVIFILYLLLFTSYKISYLFDTILGRTLLFTLIIICLIINKHFGIIISIILLYYYSLGQEPNLYLGNIQATTASSSIETSKDIYASLDANNNKISLEYYLRPKQSNSLVVPNKRGINDEPMAFQQLLQACPFTSIPFTSIPFTSIPFTSIPMF